MKSPKNCSYFVKAQQNVTETKHASVGTGFLWWNHYEAKDATHEDGESCWMEINKMKLDGSKA